eukprot:7904011-Lingulodinium_polyedra.AAC.1
MPIPTLNVVLRPVTLSTFSFWHSFVCVCGACASDVVWRLAVSGWWLVVGGFWLAVGSWWLAVGGRR